LRLTYRLSYVTGRDIVQFSGQAQKKENSVYPIRPRCINGLVM
jgi:hypothetical protein